MCRSGGQPEPGMGGHVGLAEAAALVLGDHVASSNFITVAKQFTVNSVDSGSITTLGGAGSGRGRGGWPGWLAQAHCYPGQLLGARGLLISPPSAV